MHTESSTRRTIHILGGGPSGLSAAFHLTSPRFNPGWSDHYDVVVHQLGWRLGGKGATGRNADYGDRIEEHGIHLFGNMYGNSLHMMNDTFTELGTGSMTTDFEPSNTQLLSDFHNGGWRGFGGSLPHNDGVPWETDSAVATVEQLAQSVKSTVEGILHSRVLHRPGGAPESQPSQFERLEAIVMAAFAAGRKFVREGLERLLHREHESALHEVLEGLADILEGLEGEIAHQEADAADLAYWMYIQVDLLTACIRGVIADDVLGKGIDSIDGVPYRDWLTSHGCHQRTMQSGLPQAIPNTCMQYPMGDSTGLPTMAASAYLTFVLRQVLAPGAAAYFFRVSTGETIILPLYDALVQRGVRFEFFQKITKLVPSADGTRIDALEVEQQTTTKDGRPYDPIRTLADGQRVWPNQPDYSQLVDGDEWQARGIDPESWWADWSGTTTTLALGPDDQVVVALPPAVQSIVCADAAAAKPAWATMLAKVRSTPTQALQLWTNVTTDALGWPQLAGTERWIGPTFLPPLVASADFTDCLAAETWPADNRPKGLIYMCGPLQTPDPEPGFDDHGFPQRMHDQVFGQVGQLLRSLGNLLPDADQGGPYPQAMDPQVLYCPDDQARGLDRLRQQYVRANIDPNERYTLSEPGVLQYRLKSWESGYANVALSSDAIYTGFNIGSFEGSVMSGMLASATLAGSPTIERIIGYTTFHPGATGPPVAG